MPDVRAQLLFGEVVSGRLGGGGLRHRKPEEGEDPGSGEQHDNE